MIYWRKKYACSCEVSKEVAVQTVVLRVVTTCDSVVGCRRSGEKCYHHVQGRNKLRNYLTQNMEEALFLSKTSTTGYKVTQDHNREYHV
jgi:hypothetical protein